MSVDKDEVKSWAAVVTAVVAALTGVVALCDKTLSLVRKIKSSGNSPNKGVDECLTNSSLVRNSGA